MIVLRKLLGFFLWPGNAASRALSIDVSADGGQVRSLVNGLVWGAVLLILALVFHG
uniref:hypothetical protein n=1 Tax=Pararhizobium sp. IMCC3301 TaxID=3067904 RepID=UPI002741D613|nr:hypothetical protein [Pararhizobium sp. IMCC3301]